MLAQAYNPPSLSIISKIKSMKFNLAKRPSVTQALRPYQSPLLHSLPFSATHPRAHSIFRAVPPALFLPARCQRPYLEHPSRPSPGSSLVTFKAQRKRNVLQEGFADAPTQPPVGQSPILLSQSTLSTTELTQTVNKWSKSCSQFRVGSQQCRWVTESDDLFTSVHERQASRQRSPREGYMLDRDSPGPVLPSSWA